MASGYVIGKAPLLAGINLFTLVVSSPDRPLANIRVTFANQLLLTNSGEITDLTTQLSLLSNLGEGKFSMVIEYSYLDGTPGTLTLSNLEVKAQDIIVEPEITIIPPESMPGQNAAIISLNFQSSGVGMADFILLSTETPPRAVFSTKVPVVIGKNTLSTIILRKKKPFRSYSGAWWLRWIRRLKRLRLGTC